MRIFNGNSMIGGWFVGDFDSSVYKTKLFEVCYKIHEKGEVWPTHYHKGVEINYLMHGRMTINNVELNAGDIFIIDPGEIAAPEFLDKCEIIVVKAPSNPEDKYIVEE